MKQRSDEELDALLGEHFRESLEPHRARVVDGFVRHLHRRRVWRIGLATAAAAVLTITALVALERFGAVQPRQLPRSIASLPTSPSEEAVSPIMHQASWSRFQDDGMRLVDDVPVRQFRRQVVEEIQWYDPASSATVRTTVPRQQIILIGVRTD